MIVGAGADADDGDGDDDVHRVTHILSILQPRAFTWPSFTTRDIYFFRLLLRKHEHVLNVMDLNHCQFKRDKKCG